MASVEWSTFAGDASAGIPRTVARSDPQGAAAAEAEKAQTGHQGPQGLLPAQTALDGPPERPWVAVATAPPIQRPLDFRAPQCPLSPRFRRRNRVNQCRRECLRLNSVNAAALVASLPSVEVPTSWRQVVCSLHDNYSDVAF